MDNFGIRLYQSGKTRRRNANKKRQLERYRQMIAEERKVEAIEDTTMEHENISKPVQEQNVDLVDDTILTNTTVTFGHLYNGQLIIVLSFTLCLLLCK